MATNVTHTALHGVLFFSGILGTKAAADDYEESSSCSSSEEVLTLGHRLWNTPHYHKAFCKENKTALPKCPVCHDRLYFTKNTARPKKGGGPEMDIHNAFGCDHICTEGYECDNELPDGIALYCQTCYVKGREYDECPKHFLGGDTYDVTSLIQSNPMITKLEEEVMRNLDPESSMENFNDKLKEMLEEDETINWPLQIMMTERRRQMIFEKFCSLIERQCHWEDKFKKIDVAPSDSAVKPSDSEAQEKKKKKELSHIPKAVKAGTNYYSKTVYHPDRCIYYELFGDEDDEEAEQNPHKFKKVNQWIKYLVVAMDEKYMHPTNKELFQSFLDIKNHDDWQLEEVMKAARHDELILLLGYQKLEVPVDLSDNTYDAGVEGRLLKMKDEYDADGKKLRNLFSDVKHKEVDDVQIKLLDTAIAKPTSRRRLVTTMERLLASINARR